MTTFLDLTFDVTGGRKPQAGANPTAQLLGRPVDGGVRVHTHCYNREQVRTQVFQ